MSELRYSRNKNLINEEEQAILAASCAAVVGLGGLGGGSAEQLARLGIGRLILIDHDSFDETNLNRQLFSTEATLGRRKAEVALERLRAVNSTLDYVMYDEKLTEANAHELLAGAQIVVDAVDNIETRLVLQEICKKLELPLVYGAIGGWYGQVSFIAPGDDTLDLIYPDPSAAGIEKKLGNPAFTPALVASIQVAEALKFLLGRGDLLRRKLLVVDLLHQDYSVLDLEH